MEITGKKQWIWRYISINYAAEKIVSWPKDQILMSSKSQERMCKTYIYIIYIKYINYEFMNSYVFKYIMENINIYKYSNGWKLLRKSGTVTGSPVAETSFSPKGVVRTPILILH